MQSEESDEAASAASLAPPASSSGFGAMPQMPAHTGRIRKSAYTQDYFKTFFVQEKELGRGGKGVVWLVRHHIDGCYLGHFACKRVPVGDDHAWLEKGEILLAGYRALYVFAYL